MLAWVFTSYNITFAALLLVGRQARRPDGATARRSCVGLVLFAVGVADVAAIAPDVEVLIGGRVLQACGSALIYPASLALLLPQFPPSRRSMAIGVWGGVAGLGGAIAPTLGAVLVEFWGWRAVFFINLPFVAGARSASAGGSCPATTVSARASGSTRSPCRWPRSPSAPSCW